MKFWHWALIVGGAGGAYTLYKKRQETSAPSAPGKLRAVPKGSVMNKPGWAIADKKAQYILTTFKKRFPKEAAANYTLYYDPGDAILDPSYHGSDPTEKWYLMLSNSGATLIEGAVGALDTCIHTNTKSWWMCGRVAS